MHVAKQLLMLQLVAAAYTAVYDCLLYRFESRPDLCVCLLCLGAHAQERHTVVGFCGFVRLSLCLSVTRIVAQQVKIFASMCIKSYCLGFNYARFSTV